MRLQLNSRARRAGLLCAVAFTLIASGIAFGWVRSVTDKGTPIFWPGTCTWIAPDQTGTPDLTFKVVQDALARSIANWQNVTLKAGCSYLVINQDPPIASEAHYDKVNVLKFRTDKWCRPAEGKTAEMCYSGAAAAITTVFYVSDPGKPADGSIVDADIQMNDVNFTFTVHETAGPLKPDTQEADLENTLTHELGHFQGLDHTCLDHPVASPPTDGATGKQVALCDEVINHMVPISEYYRVTQATMFNFATAGEVSKRTPKADDIAGICGIYPVAKNPNKCERPNMGKSGCSVGAGGAGAGGGPVVLGLLFVIGAIVRRRR